MKYLSIILTLLVTVCLSHSSQAETYQGQDYEELAKQPGTVVFTPPKGWRFADAKSLPSSVKMMVVGKGDHEFPPTLNLSTEEYPGELNDYLKIVKDINNSQGADWKDLGTIRTEAGNASLSQVDTKTEWGDVRMMHVILLRGGHVYILTAAALKSEFSKFYKDFFASLRSLRINEVPQEIIVEKTS